MSTTIRKATEDDYEAVMNLDKNGKIYNGMDYLPANYHRFLGDPKKDMYVFVQDGEVVAFMINAYVDNGASVIGMAARTHSEQRGHNFWSTMRKTLTLQDRETPGLKYRISVAPGEEWQRIKQQGHRIWKRAHLTDRHWLASVVFDPASILRYLPLSSPATSTIRIITPNEVIGLLRRDDIRWRLFPTRRITCGVASMVFRVIEENYNDIIDKNDLFTANFDASDDCKSIGFGCGSKVPKGYRYALYYFGQPSTDIKDIMFHVMLHLPVSARLAKDSSLYFAVYVSASTDINKVADAFKSISGFVRINVCLPVVVFEYEKQTTDPSKL